LIAPAREPPSDHAPRRAERRPCLAARIDEAIEPLHAVMPMKVALVALTALGSLFVLPWQTCLAWAAVCYASEAALWAATRPSPPPVTTGGRRLFLSAYLANNFSWLALGVLFWTAGEPIAQATGVAVFLTVAVVSVLLFHNVPAVFLAAGGLPTLGAMTVLVMADGRGWREMAPVWIVVALGAVFSLSRALDTPSAQAQQRRLNKSLKEFEALAANVTDVIARTNLDGTYEYVSPASLEVLGYRPEELIGTSRWDICHPDVPIAAMREAYQRMVADPSQPEVMTVQMRHKDGRWLWLQSSARLIVEDGVPVATIDVCRDVSTQVAAEAALQEAKGAAEAATLAKAEFLANVSHEIRTPMNGVLGALHLLERENITDEGRELLRRANDCGRMLSQLLNDVLDFSKIEAGQLDLHAEPMDLGEALEAVVGLLKGQAAAKDVDLRHRLVGDQRWIEADPVRMRQILFNLVGNAVKFTPAGHVDVSLAIKPSPEGRLQVRIDVRDTGIGMSPADQARLFERFHQAETDTARRFGGAGLGLSITQALVRMMDGRIGFQSEAGAGSHFWIELTAPAAAPAAPQVVTDAPLSDVRILLVEDNATNRLVARTLLSRLGAHVDEAEDGLGGVEAARRGAYDLILMDIQMPRMSGLDAAREIRSLPGASAYAPIIALTANAMLHQRRQYLAAGMNGVVAKPLSAGALLGEIAAVMAAADARQAV
jgi:PAS domain S-box-containing protein